MKTVLAAAAALGLFGAGPVHAAPFTDISPPGGSVYAAAVHPLESHRLIAVTPGSVQVTRDGGRTWFATTPSSVVSVDRIFTHRGRPGVVYVQEQAQARFGIGFAALSGGRTFRSEDFGETWTQMPGEFRAPGDLVLSPFGSDPIAPEHVFATDRTSAACEPGCVYGTYAFDAGLRESYDGGHTWSGLGAFPNVVVGSRTTIEGPTPAAPKRMFLGVDNRFARAEAKEARVFVSGDGGQAWVALPTPADWSLQRVMQDPVRAKVLYGFGERIGGIQEYRRSDDGGSSWRAIWGAFTQNPPQLLVDPIHQDRLWLYGAIGVWLSDDGGLNWRELGLALHPNYNPTLGVATVMPDPVDSTIVYALRTFDGRLYRIDAPARSPVAVEYRIGDRFWMTANAAEAGALGYMGYHERRTGQRFGVWSRTEAPAGALGACRFQGNPAYDQHSRFVTLAGSECEGVKRAPAFVLEGENEYFAVPPDARGGCATGLAVRRFNNGHSSVNHRYVASDSAAAEMRAAGWHEEGVAFCARPLRNDE